MKEGMKKIPYLRFIPFFFISVGLTIFSLDHIFFWDTVQLGSKQAHWFFETNFSSVLLPDQIDSGHPPIFGIYLAVLWTLFGKTLAVSHLAMLPFLFGIVLQSDNLGRFFLGKNLSWLFPLLVFVNPYFLGQSILISPDIVLLFFFLLSLNALFKQKKLLLVLGLLGLSLISMRGMMLVFCLALYELIFSIRPSIGKRIKDILPKYLVACSLAIIFLIFHYASKSWIGFHADSPWAQNFEFAGIIVFLKNVLVFGWRMIDFGNIFILLSCIVLFLWYKRKGKYINQGAMSIFSMLTIILVVFALVMIPFKSLLNPRYFMPAVLLMSFGFAILFVPLFKQGSGVKYYFIAIVIGLFAGNFWIYPDHISQGWDSTIGHYPYYNLRSEMNEYIRANEVPIDSIGTEFPNRSQIKFLDLSSDTTALKESDINKDNYILYSNVMNDFTDKEIEELKSHWKAIKHLERLNIKMILYKRQ